MLGRGSCRQTLSCWPKPHPRGIEWRSWPAAVTCYRGLSETCTKRYLGLSLVLPRARAEVGVFSVDKLVFGASYSRKPTATPAPTEMPSATLVVATMRLFNGEAEGCKARRR